MWQLVADGVTYLQAQSGDSLLRLFWFVVLFELPRYTLSFISVAAIRVGSRPKEESPRPGPVSVVIAGHNEEDSIERCVRSLLEQSQPPDEIIVVSDGSTDRTVQKLHRLLKSGVIKEAHCTQVRSGKSAGVNLAVSRTTGKIIVNVDCDCTFDRHALKHIVEPFSDPAVGAVAGNIVVRNPKQSVVTTFQAIEYLISISHGKQAANLTDQMSCVSGAFGAFRRQAFFEVGGLDAGGGEDLDITLNLRKAGWKTVFAADAFCYTDVPSTFAALVRQRFRWERDAIRLRYRKHREMLNPWSPRFSFLELTHEVDFFVFSILSAAIFPFYLLWLFASYGDLALTILLGAQVGLLGLDFATFLLAAAMSRKVDAVPLIPYVPGYSLFNGLLMRFVRLGAYLQEWVFRASYQDTYVPGKVHRVRR